MGAGIFHPGDVNSLCLSRLEGDFLSEIFVAQLTNSNLMVAEQQADAARAHNLGRGEAGRTRAIPSRSVHSLSK
jgi:hypothetical protein